MFLSQDEKKTLYMLLREDKGNVLDQFLMGKNHYNYANKSALTVTLLGVSFMFYQPGSESPRSTDNLFLECKCARCFNNLLGKKSKVLNDFSRLQQMAKKITQENHRMPEPKESLPLPQDASDEDGYQTPQNISVDYHYKDLKDQSIMPRCTDKRSTT